jgi:hypothetical protein
VPTIGRVVQGGPMIRIRDRNEETAEQTIARANREAKKAREAGDEVLAKSWEFVAQGDILAEIGGYP